MENEEFLLLWLNFILYQNKFVESLSVSPIDAKYSPIGYQEFNYEFIPVSILLLLHSKKNLK